MPTVEFQDLIKVGLLVVLEALLSADNAIVLAVLIMPLPHDQRGKALWYGIAGAFAFRVVAVLLASLLMKNPWIVLLGGFYLVYLPVKHFRGKHRANSQPTEEHRSVGSLLGLSQFWSIAIVVQLTDMVFSIDSILAAVAMARGKVWVVITGGILGIIAMRIVTGKFLKIIERFPALVDGAYVIVLWMGLKLILIFLHETGRITFELPEWIYLSVIGVIFAVSLLMERKIPEVFDETIEESIEILEERE